MPYLEYSYLLGSHKTITLSFDQSNHKDIMKLINKIRRKQRRQEKRIWGN
jgi:hypothetical protein